MHNTLKNNTMGGGQRPPLATILSRTKYYAFRRWHLPLGTVAASASQRQQVVYTLRQHFEVPVPTIATLLNVTARTVYRDYDAMNIIIKRSKKDRQQVEDLRDYILYIYKYLP